MNITDLRKGLEIFRRLATTAKLPSWAVPAMVALALLGALFEALCLALIIPLLRSLNDSVSVKGDQYLVRFLNDIVAYIPLKPHLLAIVIAVLAAAIIKALISYGNLALLGVVYGHTSHGLRLSLFSKMLSLPLAETKGERATRLLHVINNETWRATDALHEIFIIITALATIAVFVPVLLILSWQLSIIAALCIIFIPLLGRVLARRITQLGMIGRDANQELTQRSQSATSSLRMIRAYGREDLEIDRLRASSDRVRRVYLRRALISMTGAPLSEVLIALLVTIFALTLEAGQVALPTLVGFLVMLFWLRPRISTLLAAERRLAGLEESVAEVSELLEGEDTAKDRGKQAFTHLRLGIRFENVSFTYPEGTHSAVKDVSFQIGRGSTVAIVGAPGAGKSTLLDLLLRIQMPQHGNIRLDGVSLDNIDPTSWRAGIGIVGQDTYILEDTVRANILYGKASATIEEVEAAARFAGADDFIRALSKSYDTVIGTRGAQISVSQRQLIALARALIRNPEILLIDEATSGLDKIGEHAYRSALERFAKNRTVIIVANEIAFVERADLVIVLEDGAVVQEGPPHMLLGLEGPFATLFRSPYRATSMVLSPR